MTNWDTYWQTHPRSVAADDYLGQVGKVWKGERIAAAQLDALLEDIRKGLDLGPDDRLLDLCCGNGLVTARLAERCREVVGIDYSETLLAVAETVHLRENITYYRMTVPELDQDPLRVHGPFDKVLMYEALQHFAWWDLSTILADTLPLTTSASKLLFGSVPDERRRWQFVDTPERRKDYLARLRAHEEPIGSWWHPVLIEDAAREHGLDHSVRAQNPILHTAHYRMDICFHRKE